MVRGGDHHFGFVPAEVEGDVGIVFVGQRVEELVFFGGFKGEDVFEGDQGEMAVVGGGIVFRQRIEGERERGGGLLGFQNGELVLEVLDHEF